MSIVLFVVEKDVFMWLPTGFRRSVFLDTSVFVFDFKQNMGASPQSCDACSCCSCGSRDVDQVPSLKAKGVNAALWLCPYWGDHSCEGRAACLLGPYAPTSKYFTISLTRDLFAILF